MGVAHAQAVVCLMGTEDGAELGKLAFDVVVECNDEGALHDGERRGNRCSHAVRLR